MAPAAQIGQFRGEDMVQLSAGPGQEMQHLNCCSVLQEDLKFHSWQAMGDLCCKSTWSMHGFEDLY